MKTPNALVSGDPLSVEVAGYVHELRMFLIEHVPSKLGWTTIELIRLPKGQAYDNGRRRAVAVPPYSLWPNMIETLIVYTEIREKVGVPLSLRGYRPPDYNEVVGGAPHSRHTIFAALDVYGPMDEIVQYAAEAYRNRDGMGLGVYRGNIHIDTGRVKNTLWGSGVSRHIASASLD